MYPIEMPYFLHEKEWYKEEVIGECLFFYRLSNKAPKRARESYEKYLEDHYFMLDPSWYSFKDNHFILSEDAPQKAIDSYQKFIEIYD